jgi:hypothetical protein
VGEGPRRALVSFQTRLLFVSPTLHIQISPLIPYLREGERDIFGVRSCRNPPPTLIPGPALIRVQ